MTAVVNATGYTKLTIDNLSGSTASPFSNADNIFLDVGLAGDKGDTGSLSSLTATDGNFIVGNGSAFVAESGATARTSLGLGVFATATEGQIAARVAMYS